MAVLTAPQHCFDGYFTALACCGPVDRLGCWTKTFDGHRAHCCHGWALQARELLQKKLAQVQDSEGPCPASFDLFHFRSMGMPLSATKWVVTDADVQEREAFQLGHRQLADRCSHEALHEDEEEATVRLWDSLPDRSGRIVNFGAGSWVDPLWAVALQRNATGLFVDPMGPPKELPPPPRGIQFVSGFVRSDNIRQLLRRSGFGGTPAFRYKAHAHSLP
ncbi:PPP2R5D [Symbiodinium natans]|uniref:PPP2R5D protein n=1 Tax=Symbiodinium natans TaxID=878477 RepID=A0A812H1Q9_9DINO|nr:PPP2R5D [Symbiodinium natans]